MYIHYAFEELEEFKTWLEKVTRNTPEDVVLMLTPRKDGMMLWDRGGTKLLMVRVCLTYPVSTSASAMVQFEEEDGLRRWAQENNHDIYYGQVNYILPGDA